jgi:hypothetical protein
MAETRKQACIRRRGAAGPMWKFCRGRSAAGVEPSVAAEKEAVRGEQFNNLREIQPAFIARCNTSFKTRAAVASHTMKMPALTSKRSSHVQSFHTPQIFICRSRMPGSASGAVGHGARSLPYS